MKYAWIKNGIIQDVCQNDTPNKVYHPDVAQKYTAQVPDTAENGDSWDGTSLTKPVITQPEQNAAMPKLSPIEFKLMFTPQERIAIKAARATDPIVDDFFSLIDDPRLTVIDLGLQAVQDGLDYLITKTLITHARADEVLAGDLKKAHKK